MPSERPIDPRISLALTWVATMVLVVFVDLFSLYRPDVRDNIESGTMFVFEIGPAFLLGILIYVAVPLVMSVLCLFLPFTLNRVSNIVVAVVFGVTVVGGAIGEWAYYVLASGIEVAFLALIVVVAARWRRVPASVSAERR